MYTEKVLEHFFQPKNVGRIENADGVGTVGDPSCGDYLRLSIKVEQERIADIRFEVYGCPAAIATSSIFTEMVKGKRLEEALNVSDVDIVEFLGGLPDPKIHCSNLGALALRRAIEDYQLRRVPQGMH
ncbi:MAG: iron-sulfur cluster assembly scaffold protein [Bacillota bacterium]